MRNDSRRVFLGKVRRRVSTEDTAGRHEGLRRPSFKNFVQPQASNNGVSQALLHETTRNQPWLGGRTVHSTYVLACAWWLEYRTIQTPVHHDQPRLATSPRSCIRAQYIEDLRRGATKTSPTHAMVLYAFYIFDRHSKDPAIDSPSLRADHLQPSASTAGDGRRDPHRRAVRARDHNPAPALLAMAIRRPRAGP